MFAPAQRRRIIGGGAAWLAALLAFVGAAAFALWQAAPPAAGEPGAGFDAYVLGVARFTLWQASLSTALSILLAIPVARALARRSAFPGRIWIVRLMALPLGLPALVAALGILEIWGRQGVVNAGLAALGVAQPFSIYGLPGILIAHVFFNLPLAARLMLAELERLPGEYWRVSASLGMGPGSLFRFVEWPAMRSVLPGAAGLIFILCATSFTLVLTLGGGPAASTLEVAIYQALRFDFDPRRAMLMSALQILFMLVVLAGLRLIGPVAESGMTGGGAVRRFDGRGGLSIVGDGLAIALAVGFVAAPLLAVASSGLAADLQRLIRDPLVHQAFMTSLVIAVSSALLSLSMAIPVLRARQGIAASRRVSTPLQLLAALLRDAPSVALLVPPVVLGSGWFLLLRGFGNVSGFAGPVVVAINALMALPFVCRVLEPALEAYQVRTARLVAALGMGGLPALRLVVLPVLARPLLAALSFAMALSLGDLGAVALFGSQDFVTLPWLLFSRMGAYRSADAAGLALILALLCLLLTIAGAPRARNREKEES
ncbi:thiamine transport system permease protein [Rhizobium sp. RU20A]|uniref:thiamine/thiamine pyrophosphate ABC transporter permease n=1 Tax=Rhizobium sp. RU20A TaxID=1907412 RepID=UPI000955EF7D|nr:thiamine/thiamine pyrophosphate ABC transporter permease [Rhizobium sp. RU20A]SIR39883.1 thiamine transport system permease protein [Rhizobium sp. RU20A]